MDQSFIGKRMEPAKFYALAEVIKSVSEKKVIDLDKIKFKIDQSSKIIFEDYSQISKSNSSFMRTSLSSIKRKTNPFGSLESQDEEAEKYKNTISGTNTLFVLNESLRVINSAWNYLNDVANNLVPGTLILSDERFDSKKLTAQDLQNMVYEFELNSQVMSNFVAAVLALKDAKKEFLNSFISFKGVLERYYRYLNERHSTEGIKVYHNPILVDIAILIHENIDAHGELEQGKKVDEISAYSLNKAYALVETFNKGICSQIIQTPNLYIEYIIENMKSVWQACSTLNEMFKDEIFKIEKIINKYNSSSSHSIELEFDSLLESFMDLDPQNVNYVDKVTIRSPEERHVFNFTNETIEYIANSVQAGLSSRVIVRKVLERKSELTKFFREENSFYTCKIGSGNPFLGEAPGSLQVIPSQRPIANLDDIRGSGFAELKKFFKDVKVTDSFRDLFCATSPSKTTDKSNVLLIGPPGAGKTLALKSVGCDDDSIAVFAQGSDFLTCWKGEAEKNPKRLFEAGVKLQKESSRHVHFLIDEIDSVLNNDRHPGETNLSLEFQILMDGVVQYNGLSLWGATNFPERIPTALLRRFHKVLLVGELEKSDIVELLKHYVGFMPTRSFSTEDWETAAERLNGATGDIVRKVADNIWRQKMSQFTQQHETQANDLVKWLNRNDKFDIHRFSKEDRDELKRKLSNHVFVEPYDVNKQIDLMLKDPAILTEVATAVNTYNNARSLLKQL